MSAFNNFVNFVANIVAPMQRQFINFVRIAICIVMVWIGGLKVCQYEADGIAHLCLIARSLVICTKKARI